MKLFVLIILSAATCLPCAAAGPYERDGFPCAVGVCVGAGLDSLEKIPWHPARDKSGSPTAKAGTRPQDDTGQAKAVDIYRGDLADALPFLIDKSFDSSAFPALKKVTHACAVSALAGTFTTPGGKKATVTIRLQPDPRKTGGQRWIVNSVTVDLPELKTDGEKLKATRILESRYKTFRKPLVETGEGAFVNYGRDYTVFIMDGSGKALAEELMLACVPPVSIE